MEAMQWTLSVVFAFGGLLVLGVIAVAIISIRPKPPPPIQPQTETQWARALRFMRGQIEEELRQTPLFGLHEQPEWGQCSYAGLIGFYIEECEGTEGVQRILAELEKTHGLIMTYDELISKIEQQQCAGATTA